jgi:membrane protease YdiL (CAAX protease family)
MRRSLFACCALLLASRLSAINLPEGGLPEGRLASAPVVPARQATVGAWNVLRDFLGGGGSSLPGASVISSLDPSAGRYAAGALVGEVPSRLWADIYLSKNGSAADKERAAAALKPYLEAAAKNAGKGNVDAAARLQAEIDAGRLGFDDLQDAAAALRGLSAHDPALRGAAGEVATALESEKSRRAALTVARVTESWQDGKQAVSVVQSPESVAASTNLQPATQRKRTIGRALKWTGVALLGGAAVAAVHPQWLHVPEQLSGFLTWAGAAFSMGGRFFAMPRGPPSQAPAAVAPQGRVRRALSWLAGRVPSFKDLSAAAGKSADAQKNFEGAVGDASRPAFSRWLSGAARTALYWFPLALGAMLGGSLLASVGKYVMHTAHAAVAAIASADAAGAAGASMSQGQAAGLLGASFFKFFNGYVATAILQSVAVVGVGYGGLRWALTKMLPARFHPKIVAGALTLAAYGAFLVYTGFGLPLALPLIGIQAVVLGLYERSGSLWAAAGVQALVALVGLESARMMAGISLAATGTLIGLPAWGGLALAGILLGAAALVSKFKLVSFFKAQVAKLKTVGEEWTKPRADGSPRSPLQMLATGLLWALPMYLAMDFAFAGIHHFLPQTEPTPEILKRMILSPFDTVLFNFVIVAMLEEWVFRKGVFKPLVNKFKKWFSPVKSWFWPAAILSSLIFSGAHYIEWSHPLAQFGIGHADIGSALAGAYAFTWASFFARAVGGMLLCFLYARSGLLLVPMIAHFGSNVLESIGMRWGLWPFLGTAAGVLALQWYASVRARAKAGSGTKA